MIVLCEQATETTGEEKQQSRSLRRSITQKWPTIVTPSSYASKVRGNISYSSTSSLKVISAKWCRVLASRLCK